MAKTAILLDFDDTIFNTVRFKAVKHERVLEEIAEELTYTDAIEFLDNLDHRKFTPVILTFSLNKEFQNIKIMASGVARHKLPVIVTEIENKNDLIASWLDGKIYKIPGVGEFESIVFVDDREQHFVGFGELPNAKGFLIQRAVMPKDSVRHKLPKNVSKVTDFNEIHL